MGLVALLNGIYVDLHNPVYLGSSHQSDINASPVKIGKIGGKKFIPW